MTRGTVRQELDGSNGNIFGETSGLEKLDTGRPDYLTNKHVTTIKHRKDRTGECNHMRNKHWLAKGTKLTTKRHSCRKKGQKLNGKWL